jgi:hypothetical protein
MKKKTVTGKKETSVWLLIFYSIPSKPVSNRIRLWRRLAKAGALQLKGAVYVLPYSEEHYEFCQWLMSEVSSLGGEGDFVMTDKFEILGNNEIGGLFDRQRESDYRKIEKGLDELEVKLNSVRKGSKAKNMKVLNMRLKKYLKELDDIRQVDFFRSKHGRDIENKIEFLRKDVKKIISADGKKGAAVQKISVSHRRKDDYLGRTWVTRKNPFVDRMASAWLIKKFIDKRAVFSFIDEKKEKSLKDGSVTFDIKGGEITHVGNLCTFEVLVRSFAIKDRSVKRIAELVHELDMKDDKYNSLEAKGIEEILLGIRKSMKKDIDILEKGMAVFEMLYMSKT